MAAPQALIEKINALTGPRLTKVEDFVDFIRLRDRNRALSCASAPAFAAVWNNPENDVYDASSQEGFAFGDIVLVSFPFTSQAASKQRPAVVVSTRAELAEERP